MSKKTHKNTAAQERDRQARAPKPREKQFCRCGNEIEWWSEHRLYVGVKLSSGNWLCPTCEGGV